MDGLFAVLSCMGASDMYAYDHLQYGVLFNAGYDVEYVTLGVVFVMM